MLRTALPLGFLSVLFLAGCPSSAPPASYAIADWQVRCDSLMTGCTSGPSRLVTGLNGEMGNVVSCSASESATDRRISFTVGGSTGGFDYSLTISGARVPRGGGSPATGCTVRVEDGSNTYVGACGGAAPSTSQPCQVMIAFDVDTATGSPRMTADVLCDHLPNMADPTIMRSIFRGAGLPDPAEIQIFDCRGLSGS